MMMMMMMMMMMIMMMLTLMNTSSDNHCLNTGINFNFNTIGMTNALKILSNPSSNLKIFMTQS
jgi:hypothetical protein